MLQQLLEVQGITATTGLILLLQQQYITREVTGADAGLYELTVTDQSYGCEETTVGIIEIEAVETDVTVIWSEPGPLDQ